MECFSVQGIYLVIFCKGIVIMLLSDSQFRDLDQNKDRDPDQSSGHLVFDMDIKFLNTDEKYKACH